MKIGVKRITDEKYQYAIWCDEYAGDWVEHYHDENGHVFPCDEKALRDLFYQLKDLLDIDSGGWMPG